MRFLQSYWCPLCLGIIGTSLILGSLLSTKSVVSDNFSFTSPYRENEEWIAPGENSIPAGAEGELIRYGKDLIASTSVYLGPKGVVAPLTNGMNCQNCHIDAGTQNFGNPFSFVANNYPRYRDRSGRIESTEFRINECMQRSMNGKPLDSLSTEMRAFVAYVKWVGNNVPKGIKPKGAGPGTLHLLDRAADPQKGKLVYTQHCSRCHGDNGQGIFLADSTAYQYPPLWGEHSFNVSAGLLRLSGLAAFIRNNMPYGISFRNPELTEEQAWDVAAYISSQPRPQVFFSYDWRELKKKPFDYPFGPFADSFTEEQHRYGPFKVMLKDK